MLHLGTGRVPHSARPARGRGTARLDEVPGWTTGGIAAGVPVDRRARDGRPHNSLLRARRVDRLIFRSQDRNFWIPGRSGWSDFADSTSQSVGHRLFLSEAGADVIVTTIAFLAFNAGAIS